MEETLHCMTLVKHTGIWSLPVCLTNVLPVSKHVAWCQNFWRKALVFPQVFKPRTPPEAIALCSRLLEYTPASRLSPLEACAHAFFDELRQPNTRLPSGRELPMLFNFSTTGSRVKVSFPSLFSLLIVQLSCSCSAWWFYVCNTTLKSVCSATAEVFRLIQYASLLFCWMTLRSPYDSALNKNSPFILCRAVDPASAELNPHSSSRSLSHSCFCTRWETLIVILLTLSIAGFSASWEEKNWNIFLCFTFLILFF